MNEHRTIQAALRTCGRRFASQQAVIDPQAEGRRLTYAELLDEADTAAAVLIERGVRPGDRVALWAPNTWEWVVASLGVMFSGAVLVPINTRLRGYEAAHALARSQARVLLTVNGFLGIDYPAMLIQARADLPDLADTIILRGIAHADCLSYAALAAQAGPTSRAEAQRRSDSVREDDTAAILFTSGTTGEPKGVMLGNEALLSSFDFYASNLGLRPGDRELAIPPYSHLFGMGSSMLSPLLRGAVTVPFAVWDPATALQVIEQEAITAVPGAPAIFQSLMQHPDLERFDISSLRSAVTGATVIPEELVVELRERLGLSLIVTGYGMTESSGCCTYTRPGDSARTVATTSGCPVPGVQVRVVDEAGRDLPHGKPGEILIRGFNVMQGYFRDPAATRAAVDAKGWLHSGDVGVLDERGYLDITGRKTDMFIVGGFNTYPAEVENALRAHPAVDSVAVVGVADDRLGEVGAAFVIPRPGESPESGDLLSWCRDRLANYKVPRYLWFTGTLPMNASGKVLRHQLRDRAAELRGRDQDAEGPGRSRRIHGG
jgi:acyl-CoA synthetase (AMP-forming)/AMP-acid ligase II